jgi:hypothetical protein
MRFQLTSKKWYCQGPQADGTHKQGGIGGCVPEAALLPPSAETKIPRGVRNRAHPIPIFQPIIADFSRSAGFVGHSGPSGYSIPAIALI